MKWRSFTGQLYRMKAINTINVQYFVFINATIIKICSFAHNITPPLHFDFNFWRFFRAIAGSITREIRRNSFDWIIPIWVNLIDCLCDTNSSCDIFGEKYFLTQLNDFWKKLTFLTVEFDVDHVDNWSMKKFKISPLFLCMQNSFY